MKVTKIFLLVMCCVLGSLPVNSCAKHDKMTLSFEPSSPSSGPFKNGTLKYKSSIHEYNTPPFPGASNNIAYRKDHNRGIVIEGTIFGRKVEVYEGESCSDRNKLLGSSYTVYPVTLVHTPKLKDGTHTFSFKELDKNNKSREER